MESFKGVKVGDRLVWINPEPWSVYFEAGGVYEVTGVLESESLIMVGGAWIYEKFAKDFTLEGRPSSPSGYVTKTTHQSVGDVTTTVSYHFEKYEDFQRYEDSLKEED